MSKPNPSRLNRILQKPSLVGPKQRLKAIKKSTRKRFRDFPDVISESIDDFLPSFAEQHLERKLTQAHKLRKLTDRTKAENRELEHLDQIISEDLPFLTKKRKTKKGTKQPKDESLRNKMNRRDKNRRKNKRKSEFDFKPLSP